MSEVPKKSVFIDIWPDWISLSLAFTIIVGIFYFTGLEISFKKQGEPGIYMEFTKIE